jgi:hypothetical protein
MIGAYLPDGSAFILGQHDIDRLRGGHVVSGAGIRIMYSPDLQFTDDQIQLMMSLKKSGEKLTVDDLTKIMELSKVRKVRT